MQQILNFWMNYILWTILYGTNRQDMAHNTLSNSKFTVWDILTRSIKCSPIQGCPFKFTSGRHWVSLGLVNSFKFLPVLGYFCHWTFGALWVHEILAKNCTSDPKKHLFPADSHLFFNHVLLPTSLASYLILWGGNLWGRFWDLLFPIQKNLRKTFCVY